MNFILDNLRNVKYQLEINMSLAFSLDKISQELKAFLIIEKISLSDSPTSLEKATVNSIRPGHLYSRISTI